MDTLLCKTKGDSKRDRFVLRNWWQELHSGHRQKSFGTTLDVTHWRQDGQFTSNSSSTGSQTQRTNNQDTSGKFFQNYAFIAPEEHLKRQNAHTPSQKDNILPTIIHPKRYSNMEQAARSTSSTAFILSIQERHHWHIRNPSSPCIPTSHLAQSLEMHITLKSGQEVYSSIVVFISPKLSVHHALRAVTNQKSYSILPSIAHFFNTKEVIFSDK